LTLALKKDQFRTPDIRNSHVQISSVTMGPSLGAALGVAPRLSVCPLSVPCLRFPRNRYAVETSNLVQTLRRTRVTKGENFRSKGQRSGPLRTKMCKSFSADAFLISKLIYIRLRPKSSTDHSTDIVRYISPAKMLRFVIFVCNSGGPHVAVGT